MQTSSASNGVAALMPPATRIAATTWLLLAGITALFGILYFGTLRTLQQLWEQDPNYSHGYLVPFISGYLAWRYIRHQRPGVGEAGLGAMYVLVGGMMHVAALVVSLPPVDFLSMTLVLRGLAIGIGGRNWANGLWFPILFLFFMFPLPVTWTGAFATWLQDIVSRVTGKLLQLFIVCHSVGTNILITGPDGERQTLAVAEECSGLRQIVAFVALAALIGHLSRRSWLFGVGLMLSAVPAAIIANVIRVLIMAFGARWFGVEWLSGVMHHAPVVVTLPLGLALLLLFGWLLAKCFPVPGTAIAAPSTQPVGDLDAGRGRLVSLIGALLAGVLLVFGLHWHLAQAGPVVLQELCAPLDDFPLSLRGPAEEFHASVGPLRVSVRKPLAWQTANLAPEKIAEQKQAMKERIKFAEDLISRVYFPEQAGPPVRVYMVFSAVGEDRNHHPEICVGTSLGLQEAEKRRPDEDRGHKRFPLQGNDRRPVERFQYDAGSDDVYTVYYWYYTLDPTITESHSFVQAMYLRNRRLPSLTVQVSTDAPLSPRALAEIENSLLVAVDAEIRKTLLPAGARMGCERIPIKWTGVKME